MSYFLTQDTLNSGGVFEISGSEFKHIILSRRSKANDTLEFQDPQINRWLCQILEIKKNSAILKVTKQLELPSQPQIQIHLLQALTADPALDLIIQKSTELGVSKITIFFSQNSPYHKADSEKKLHRWEIIAQEACKQSGRPQPPEITLKASLKACLTGLNETQLIHLALPTTSEPAKTLKLSNKISLVTGPEGGLSASELNELTANQSYPLTIGNYTLRSDTASVAGISALLALHNHTL